MESRLIADPRSRPPPQDLQLDLDRPSIQALVTVHPHNLSEFSDPSHNQIRDGVSHQAGELLAQASIQDKDQAELPNKFKDKISQMTEVVNREKQGMEKNKGALNQPLSTASPIGNLKERLLSSEEEQQPHKVDLVEIMKNLQLEIPGDIEYVFPEVAALKSEENTPFKLLIKVASTGGASRNIPLQHLNEAMSRAWGENYWVIDQVKSGMYIAYFRDEEALNFVLQRQPWTVDNDNLLIEWINPRNADKSVESYDFKYVYARIRVYGVPEKFRGPHLMNYVIENVAAHSDLHPPPELKMSYTREYISAYAKFDISKHVKDKVKYYISSDQYIVFYLNFEKIKRICTFCGVMFHTVEHCATRRRLILHMQSIGASTATVPFSYLGLWMAQPSKIPREAIDQANLVGGLSEAFRKQMRVDRSSSSSQLTLSQFAITKCSSENKSIQGKKPNEEFNVTHVSDQGLLGYKPVTNTPMGGDARLMTFPEEVHDHGGIKYQVNQTQNSDEGTQQAAITSITAGIPVEELPNTIRGKNPEAPVTCEGEVIENTTGGAQAAQDNQEGEPQSRYTEWDVLPTAGSGNINASNSRLLLSGSGGPIRNRYNFSKKVGSRTDTCEGRDTALKKMGYPYFHRRSKSSTGVGSSVGKDYDPWPLHTPSPNYSSGIVSSHYGAFSHAQEVRDGYVNTDFHHASTKIVTRTQEHNQDSNYCTGDALHLQQTNKEGEMDVDGAMAPALKAPRAP